ncbi:DNA replication/repair protein RecF [Fibrobacter sp.]|uniref:DNA replication/repair protein RecF n=1 Tax=Fibrobacter sp. TaxID=35828 RepID=UPI0025C66FA3|nr:DNA replication and repair protein RecF [Fibrobacter sp.]MBR4008059.1 DNA replication/repair protein RecF [Fibrobacter sp.]
MISSLSLAHVRSLDGREYRFVPGINVIHGKNGCGKTTVLEAVHLLAQGFSFRAHDLKELIAWNANEMILRGVFEYDGRELGRAVQIGRYKNIVKENGEPLRAVSQFFGKAPAVIMQPSDIELLRGAPEIRRRWLDEILCFRSASNAKVLRDYRRVLQQRNQWLRQFKKDGAALGGEDLFHVLTDQLVALGAKLWAARISLSNEISPIITGYYRRLSGGVDTITCNYKSSILKDLDALDAAVFMDENELEAVAAESSPQYAPEGCDAGENGAGGSASDAPVSEDMLKNAFAEKLAGLEFIEKLQGITMSGPHKDDLALCASGYEMRSVGSQGQCRSAAIAMRFAAVDVAARYLTKPVLLLDDIFAELDVDRRGAVASLIREKDCQVLIATPQVEELPFTADAEISLSD